MEANTNTNPFRGLGWPKVRAVAKDRGYALAEGKASTDGTGYYPADEKGGYECALVPCSEAHQVKGGTPASHGVVAFRQ